MPDWFNVSFMKFHPITYMGNIFTIMQSMCFVSRSELNTFVALGCMAKKGGTRQSLQKPHCSKGDLQICANHSQIKQPLLNEDNIYFQNEETMKHSIQ